MVPSRPRPSVFLDPILCFAYEFLTLILTLLCHFYFAAPFSFARTPHSDRPSHISKAESSGSDRAEARGPHHGVEEEGEVYEVRRALPQFAPSAMSNVYNHFAPHPMGRGKVSMGGVCAYGINSDGHTYTLKDDTPQEHLGRTLGVEAQGAIADTQSSKACNAVGTSDLPGIRNQRNEPMEEGEVPIVRHMAGSLTSPRKGVNISTNTMRRDCTSDHGKNAVAVGVDPGALELGGQGQTKSIADDDARHKQKGVDMVGVAHEPSATSLRVCDSVTAESATSAVKQATLKVPGEPSSEEGTHAQFKGGQCIVYNDGSSHAKTRGEGKGDVQDARNTALTKLSLTKSEHKQGADVEQPTTKDATIKNSLTGTNAVRSNIVKKVVAEKPPSRTRESVGQEAKKSTAFSGPDSVACSRIGERRGPRQKIPPLAGGDAHSSKMAASRRHETLVEHLEPMGLKGEILPVLHSNFTPSGHLHSHLLEGKVSTKAS